MYEKYDESVLKARQFLVHNIIRFPSIINFSEGSKSFKAYMQNNNLYFSKNSILQWLWLYKDDWSIALYQQYRRALYFIYEVYTTGQATKSRFIYDDNLPQNELSPFLKILFVEFKNYELDKHTVAT